MCVTGKEILLDVGWAVRSAVIRLLLDERTRPYGRRVCKYRRPRSGRVRRGLSLPRSTLEHVCDLQQKMEEIHSLS